jgi:hypothetical protein
MRAAVLGLLATAQTACSDSPSETADGGGGSAGASGGGAGGAGGTENAVEGVTSTKTIVDLTLEEFTKMCDDARGSVEIHPHCGGFVTGKGFSYDSTIDTFTEHTCRGYNTCTGFSCVIPDEG